MAPRRTFYAGIAMRSRTEALYAKYLDASGITWKYEPDCYDGPGTQAQYLPDFGLYVKGEPTHYVDVKPGNVDAGKALAAMRPIHMTDPGAHLAVVANVGSYEEPLWRSLRASGSDRCLTCWPRRTFSVVKAILDATEPGAEHSPNRLSHWFSHCEGTHSEMISNDETGMAYRCTGCGQESFLKARHRPKGRTE